MDCAVPENINTHPKEGHWKFQGGKGVSKAKCFTGKYEFKFENPGVKGFQTKKISVGGMYISGNHTLSYHAILIYYI